MAGAAETIEVADDTVVDIEVDVADEASKAVVSATEAVTVAAPAPATTEAADALADAQRKIDAERRRREAAEATANSERARADQATRLAQQAEQEAATAREAVVSGELTAVTAGLASAQKAIASAKAGFKAAHEAGDIDKMTEAQEALGHATAELRDFNNRKAAIETGKRTTVAPEIIQRPTITLSPLEQYLQGGTFAPAAQNWLRMHPECVPAAFGGDQRKNDAMMAAHYDAKEKGITPNTTEYFEHIEKRIAGGSEAAAADPRSKAATAVPAVPKKVAPAPSAPPTNEPPAVAGTATRAMRSVRLTPAQQETALFSYPAKHGEEEDAHRRRAFKVYAQEFLKASAEGKIGRLTH
jgi:hypothetical protein